MANVRRHLGIIRTFGVPAVVAVNRRPGDTNEEVELVKRLALEAGAFAAEVNDGFAQGGAGAADLAEAVVEACEQPQRLPSALRRRRADPGQDRGGRHAGLRRQGRVLLSRGRAEDRPSSPARGSADFPVCMAKTHLSLSADPTLLNAPEGFTLPVRDIRAYTGAGWLVPLCGDITQMPGLGTTPAALNIDIDAEGRTVGLF